MANDRQVVLGPLARDLLDSLSADRDLTAERLTELTGRLYASVARSLVILLDHRLVTRHGRVSLGLVPRYGGSTPWLWRITRRGRREFARRARAGYAPGSARVRDIRAPRVPGDALWTEEWRGVYGHVDADAWRRAWGRSPPGALAHRYVRAVPLAAGGNTWVPCEGPGRGAMPITTTEFATTRSTP